MYGYQTQTGTRHCESCGTDNPQTDDGYTTCCNELVCDGGPGYVWAVGTMDLKTDDRTQTGTVRACCAARAEAKVAKGLFVLHREH